MAKCCGSSLAGFQQMLRNLLVTLVDQLNDFVHEVQPDIRELARYSAIVQFLHRKAYTELEALLLGGPGVDDYLIAQVLYRILQIPSNLFLHVRVPAFLDLSYIRLSLNLILLYHKQE